jgi:hypothetical protein
VGSLGSPGLLGAGAFIMGEDRDHPSCSVPGDRFEINDYLEGQSANRHPERRLKKRWFHLVFVGPEAGPPGWSCAQSLLDGGRSVHTALEVGFFVLPSHPCPSTLHRTSPCTVRGGLVALESSWLLSAQKRPLRIV